MRRYVKFWKFIVVLLTFISITICTSASYAASLHWDYTDSSSLTGWVCYYQVTSDTSKTYSYTLNDPAARSLDLSVLQLVPGTKYNLWLTAYNSHTESGPSNTVDYTTPGFTPPADNHPITITIEAPVTITITQP